MSRHVFVRPARKSDVPKYIEWSVNTKNNLFDPDVITYGSTFTLCAFNENRRLVMVPVQQPMFLEALAINPEADKVEVASALKALTQAAVTQAYIKGSGEIYFLCKDESTIEFAKHQQYEEVPYRLFRIKLKNLEGKSDADETKQG